MDSMDSEFDQPEEYEEEMMWGLELDSSFEEVKTHKCQKSKPVSVFEYIPCFPMNHTGSETFKCVVVGFLRSKELHFFNLDTGGQYVKPSWIGNYYNNDWCFSSLFRLKFFPSMDVLICRSDKNMVIFDLTKRTIKTMWRITSKYYTHLMRSFRRDTNDVCLVSSEDQQVATIWENGILLCKLPLGDKPKLITEIPCGRNPQKNVLYESLCYFPKKGWIGLSSSYQTAESQGKNPVYMFQCSFYSPLTKKMITEYKIDATTVFGSPSIGGTKMNYVYDRQNQKEGFLIRGFCSCVIHVDLETGKMKNTLDCAFCGIEPSTKSILVYNEKYSIFSGEECLYFVDVEAKEMARAVKRVELGGEYSNLRYFGDDGVICLDSSGFERKIVILRIVGIGNLGRKFDDDDSIGDDDLI